MDKCRHAVRISDGLGNQMFQYAFAYALHKRSGNEVLIDPLFWGTSLRKYSLGNYNLSLKRRLVSPTLDYCLGFGPRNGRYFKYNYRRMLIKKIYNYVYERELMKFDPEMLSPKVSSFYEGFWQTPKYFEMYKDEIKKEFSRTTKLSVEALRYMAMVETMNSVSLHVRRTDYVRDEGNVALKLSYYDKALKYLAERIGEYRLFVFSDDKSFVKKSFDGIEYILVDGLSDLDEFEVMKNCKHHIIANSTYSWWAAYLGDESGITIAPRVDIWGKDYYPSNWHILEAEV